MKIKDLKELLDTCHDDVFLDNDVEMVPLFSWMIRRKDPIGPWRMVVLTENEIECYRRTNSWDIQDHGSGFPVLYKIVLDGADKETKR